MIRFVFAKKKKLDRLYGFLFILLPFVSACSPNKQIVEIVVPPKLPADFSSIPEEIDKPELLALQSADQKIKDIKVGRYNPFQPPQFDSDELLVPDSFKYHGQISTSKIVNAFVSYKDLKGTIKEGDIGGENTNLLPPGWVVESIDLKTQSLTLSMHNNSVEIDLFPIEKP